MAKVRKIDSKKQDDQPVVANPFKHIDLFPGFVPTQETIDYVNARLGNCPINARLEKLRLKRQAVIVPEAEVA